MFQGGHSVGLKLISGCAKIMKLMPQCFVAECRQHRERDKCLRYFSFPMDPKELKKVE